MSWWPLAATNVVEKKAAPVQPTPRMTLGPISHVGEYIEPHPRRQIWAFNILLDGRYLAGLTADDNDLDSQRKLGERICFAYNEVFASDRKSDSNS